MGAELEDVVLVTVLGVGEDVVSVVSQQLPLKAMIDGTHVVTFAMTTITSKAAVGTVPALIESAKDVPSVPEIPTVGTAVGFIAEALSKTVKPPMPPGALLKMTAPTAPILPAVMDFAAKVQLPREIRAIFPVMGEG